MTNDQPRTITSTRNPLVREILKLREKRWRDRLGQFAIEGYREAGRALEREVPFRMLIQCPELFADEGAEALVEEARGRGIRVRKFGPDAFRRLSYRDRPDGIIAVADTVTARLSDLVLTSPALLLVVESIEKPGNLGAVLRSCDGVGADAVIVCDAVTDLFNPNVVRASLGTLFSRPVVQCSSEEAVAWLRGQGIAIVATSPDAGVDYTDADLSGDVALILGAEDKGLSARWLEGATGKVAIPMRGDADSLNIGMAATLVLYEALRQRNSRD